MTVETIARAYIACVELEERLRHDSVERADDAAVLRADLHALLMQALRDARIPFADRSEAATIAFALVSGKQKIA